MGWSNWIKILEPKIIIEISRNTDIPNDIQKQALDSIIYTDSVDSDKLLTEVTIKDFRKMMSDSKDKEDLYGLNYESLLFYFFANRECDYELLKGDDAIEPYRDTDWTIWYKS